jgi:drug/metabolite transporter (DMT)-like permease
MITRSAIDARAVGLMTVLCMVWGLQQVALKATAADIAPVMQIGLRSGAAALLVALTMWVQRQPLALHDGTWRAGTIVGVLFGVEFLLVAEGLRHTSASHMVVFLYTAPIFAALGLHRRLPAERLLPLQWAGITVAFAGVALAFFSHAAPAAGTPPARALWGDFLGLMAGATWGATTVVVRCTGLSNLPATKTLLYQLVGAFVMLLAAAALTGQTGFRPTPLVWSALAFQSVVVAFASFLLWFRLLRRYLAAQLGVFTFMTPMFGVVFGAWLLHEPLEPTFVAGAVLALAGIVLVSGRGWLRRAAAQPSRG